MFSLYDVIKANNRISDMIQKTPLEKSIYLSDEKTKIYFKLESLQSVKSFKIRGALSKMTTLTEEEKKSGVVAISSGNHGVAVSYAATTLGIEKVEIIVPKNTPKSKVEKIKYFGGKVILAGDNYDEAHIFGNEYIEENNMILIDSYYEDELIYAGQGTVGLEILRQNPEIDTILVPIGGGGMISGIGFVAKSINPDVKIIGVQTEACPAMKKAMEENIFYETYPTEPSICEALVGGIGKLAFEMSHKYIDEVVLVSEKNIRRAVSHMIKKEKFIVEPSSAITVGALYENPNRNWGKNVVLVMSGGNIDENLMIEILNEK
jgi:threonine dehydratase